MSDNFEKKLLTGDGKWWEFLSEENQIQQLDLPTEDFSDQLDWSKKRALDQVRGPVGLGFYHRCIQCNKAVPPDLTFCVYCGGIPRADRRPQEFAIVISGSEDDFSINEAALWISASIPGTKRSEIESILSDPPAIFSIVARRDQVSTLCARMNDIGIYATGHLIADAPINWIRETLESAFRSPAKIAVIASIIIASVVIFLFLSWLLLPLLFAGAWGLSVLELKWYQQKYTMEVQPALNHASGFDQGLTEESIFLLQNIRDAEIRHLLSLCLMEYYSLSQGFRSEQSVYGDVLESARSNLNQLLESIFNICEKYQQLEKLEHPKVIQQRVLELKSRPNAQSVFMDQITEFERHVKVAEKNLIAMEKIKAQFHVISLKLEALRTRFLQVRDTRYGNSDNYDLESILVELDLELEIAEQTIEAVEVY